MCFSPTNETFHQRLHGGNSQPCLYATSLNLKSLLCSFWGSGADVSNSDGDFILFMYIIYVHFYIYIGQEYDRVGASSSTFLTADGKWKGLLGDRATGGGDAGVDDLGLMVNGAFMDDGFGHFDM